MSPGCVLGEEGVREALYIMVLENLAGRKTVESPGNSQEVIFPISPFPEENILKPYLNYNFRLENKSELFMLWKSHVHKQRKLREQNLNEAKTDG